MKEKDSSMVDTRKHDRLLDTSSDVFEEIQAVQGIHLHKVKSNPMWMLIRHETLKCGTDDCFRMKFKRVEDEGGAHEEVR